ncbi:MAG: TlpA family protein disulfide reductase [Haliscomenobacter sp.]|nr:TlpA family protein disulfide reductase [Haliscomenobacter sp.]MBK8656175.1 TlpA family protein disulfide reductase [Haliscomenobacter sp.]
MKYINYISFFLFLFLEFSFYVRVKSQSSTSEDFSEYYYRISHLSLDSMVLTSNNILAAKWQRDLDFLDGYLIPTFSATDIHGKIQNITYNGNLTLLNFWFIACPPCIEEIPFLNKMQDTYKEELEVISICRDAEPEIIEFMMDHPISYTVIPDARKIIEHTFRMSWGYPKNILIGPDGKVLAMTRGFLGVDDPNYKKIEHLILKYTR